jgi:hypothetical protein
LPRGPGKEAQPEPVTLAGVGRSPPHRYPNPGVAPTVGADSKAAVERAHPDVGGAATIASPPNDRPDPAQPHRPAQSIGDPDSHPFADAWIEVAYMPANHVAGMLRAVRAGRLCVDL